MNLVSIAQEVANWVAGNPSQADETRNLLLGRFAFNECHSGNVTQSMICPNCFTDFVSAMEDIDTLVAEKCNQKGYAWTTTWIEAVLA